jgi:hypothetical protein
MGNQKGRKYGKPFANADELFRSLSAEATDLKLVWSNPRLSSRQYNEEHGGFQTLQSSISVVSVLDLMPRTTRPAGRRISGDTALFNPSSGTKYYRGLGQFQHPSVRPYSKQKWNNPVPVFVGGEPFSYARDRVHGPLRRNYWTKLCLHRKLWRGQ